MAYLQHNQYEIKDTSVTANVPQNDVARLMYYLNCACSAIQYNDNDISRYRNYSNWAQLSTEELRLLIVLCYTLSPDLFNNKVFFHSDALCGNMSNKFYEINQVSHQLLAVQSIVVAGKVCRVNKIMTYKMSWMTTYYINPMQNLARRLNNQNQQSTSNSRSSASNSRSSTCVIS